MEENNIIICEKCYEENEATRSTCKNSGAKLYKGNIEKGTSKNKEHKREMEKNVLEDEVNVLEDEEYYTTNNVASIIKGLAVSIAVIGIIASIILGISMENFFIALLGSIISILSVLLLYAVGEVIEILHDSRTNLEHIRDYLESEKR